MIKKKEDKCKKNKYKDKLKEHLCLYDLKYTKLDLNLVK